MEDVRVGFYAPDERYWETNSEPSEDTRAGYPEGTIEVPLRPDANHVWQDGAWVDNPDPEGDLDREREGMVVSAFQAKAALQAAGLYVSAETAVNVAGGITLLAWQTAIEYRRNSPTIAALQVTLGLTDAQVDDLFRAAALIDA